MDRSTFDKMKYGNFHLLIEILVVFMLYQNADDNLSYLRQCSLHSLAKLFAGWARLGKTTCKESRIRNEAENYSSISVSNKPKKIYQPIFKAALFEFSYILFKILRIKNIPKPHSGAFNLVVMNRPER